MLMTQKDSTKLFNHDDQQLVMTILGGAILG